MPPTILTDDFLWQDIQVKVIKYLNDLYLRGSPIHSAILCYVLSGALAVTVGAQEGLLELLGGHLKALNQALTINNILWILQ